MEKFSTARGLACACMLLAGLCISALADSVSLAEHTQSPQPRSLPFVMPTASAAPDAWPQAIVLEAQADTFAEVAQHLAGARLHSAGKVLRVLHGRALRGPHLVIYRPGPWLEPAPGHTTSARLAFRVGRADLLPSRAGDNGFDALLVQSEREVEAGDLVLEQLPPSPETGAMHEIAAHLARQRGNDSRHLAAAGEVAALDRGVRDGVRAGMCLRLPGYGKPMGRILHAGASASAVQLVRASVPLEAGDAVLVTACTY